VLYALRQALAAFRRTTLLTALSITMIALSLFVIGLFGIAAHNVRLVLEDVESRVEVVAYLRDDASPTAVEFARSEIAAFGEVQEVRYVSRDEALDIARSELPEFQALFTDLDVNPLPASLEILLQPGSRDPAHVAAVAERVALYPFVEDVAYGSDWLEKVFVLRRVAGATALVMGGTFAAVAAVLIGAAVRMAIYARRDEIAIMRLVGATGAFIRRPFLLEGLMTGVLGGIVALLLTYAVHRVVAGSIFPLEWVPLSWTLAGLAAGGAVGVAASALAVHRHLREA